MDAHETVRVEPRFQVLEGIADHVGGAGGTYFHVVSGRLQPKNPVGLEEERAPRGLERQASGGGQRTEVLARARPQLPFNARKHGAETILVHRFQNVVEGLGFESLQCVLIVSGDEDGQRHVLDAHLAHHGEPIEARHLHIEEHDLGAQARDGAAGFRSVLAFGHDLKLAVGGEQVANGFARQRLVVHYHGADHARPRAGISIATSQPPWGPFWNSRRWSAP